MESESKVLGKINKKKCYLNHGKYGHYLTVDSKNYKVPEWMPPEKMDIDIAERLIEYKIKMSEQWFINFFGFDNCTIIYYNNFILIFHYTYIRKYLFKCFYLFKELYFFLH